MVNTLPDISEHYAGERAEAEDLAWTRGREYLRYLPPVRAAVARGARRVVELGCGAGHVAAALPPAVTDYLGVDQNEVFLAKAAARAPGRTFVRADLRVVTPGWLVAGGFGLADLVLCFAVFKHFGLHEWSDVVTGALTLAPAACFTAQTADADFDDGAACHHTAVADRRLAEAVAAAGHTVVGEAVLFDGPTTAGRRLREALYVTARTP